MNTPTIKIYRIRHRNDWCGADTIFDSYCLALKKPRKWFNISKFQELFPDWKYVIDETNRKGKEAGKENFFTDSSPETSGDENEESDGETDSELSQTILPQWPIENDQTDDDPLPLPPFKKRKQTRMDDVTSGDQNEESGEETDSDLSQSILPQWPIENDQTDDDPLPLPPFVTIDNEEATNTTFQSMSETNDTPMDGVIDNKNNLFKINNYIIEKIVITTDSDTEVDDKEKLKDVLFEPTCHIDDVINIESD